MSADVLKAAVAFLKADSDVSGLLGTRVYGLELPASEIPNMPRQSCVLKLAGGPTNIGGTTYLQAGQHRIDVFNYGGTGIDAVALQRATHDALKELDRTVQGDTLLHWAHQSSGPIWLRDPDGDWPVVVESWLVLAAETTAA